MKRPSLAYFALALAACVPNASARVSVEFQFGGLTLPPGTVGVLVADVAGDGFAFPADFPGATLSPGSSFADDIVVAVFSENGSPGWGSAKGFSVHLAGLDYAALGVAEGQQLILHLFPDLAPGGAIRPGEPHLSYRSTQVTANSTMGFALPPDRGNHLFG